MYSWIDILNLPHSLKNFKTLFLEQKFASSVFSNIQLTIIYSIDHNYLFISSSSSSLMAIIE